MSTIARSPAPHSARLPPGWWLVLCDADGNPTPRGDFCRVIGPRDIATQIYRLNDTAAAVAEACHRAQAERERGNH